MRGVAESPGAADVLTRLRLSPVPFTPPGEGGAHRGSEEWERVLWKRQRFDDNHVPSDFLSGLEINRSGSAPPSYILLVRDSGAIVQQLALVALFCWCFAFLHLCDDPVERLERVNLLNTLNIAVASLGAAVGVAAEHNSAHTAHQRGTPRQLAVRLFKMAMMLVSLRLMSPLLLTLSGTVSTDSVYAISTLCFVFHLYRFDYAYVLAVPDVGLEGSIVYPVEVEADEGSDGAVLARPAQFNGHASVVLATFSSVLLVSRLMADTEVFALIVLGILSFAILPGMQHSLRRSSEGGYGLLTMGLSGVAMCLLWRDSPRVVALTFCAACLTITFAAPLAMVWLHRGRRTINGPWDERVIVEKVM